MARTTMQILLVTSLLVTAASGATDGGSNNFLRRRAEAVAAERSAPLVHDPYARSIDDLIEIEPKPCVLTVATQDEEGESSVEPHAATQAQDNAAPQSVPANPFKPQHQDEAEEASGYAPSKVITTEDETSHATGTDPLASEYILPDTDAVNEDEASPNVPISNVEPVPSMTDVVPLQQEQATSNENDRTDPFSTSEVDVPSDVVVNDLANPSAAVRAESANEEASPAQPFAPEVVAANRGSDAHPTMVEVSETEEVIDSEISPISPVVEDSANQVASPAQPFAPEVTAASHGSDAHPTKAENAETTEVMPAVPLQMEQSETNTQEKTNPCEASVASSAATEQTSLAAALRGGARNLQQQRRTAAVMASINAL